MREFIVNFSVIGLLIVWPIAHYWVFIKDPKEKDDDEG